MSAHELVLSASGLRKEYGQGAALVHAVRDVTLEVGEGESIAIVGPSGCGKSSQLYLLGGLERPTAGTPATTDHDLRRAAGPAALRAPSDRPADPPPGPAPLTTSSSCSA